uniref:Transthyretin-like family-containing protein n=1 Tax=Parastrongyloides trichosuri TaxID=131310 RepID=A0A0N4ZYS6_PARTI
MNIITSLIFLLSIIRSCYFYKQEITTTGLILCNKKRAVGVQVFLKETDTFDPDDTLDATVTDFEGKFKLYGIEDEIKSIKPYIQIVHKCEVSDIICNRTTIYNIDKKHVGGEFDFEYINLKIKGHSDYETC